ncbi:transposase, partial [Salibacterium aidingense]
QRQLYCTNMIERFMSEIKRRSKKSVTFPTERAVEKMIYLQCIRFNENKQQTAHGFAKKKAELQQKFWEKYGTTS